MVVCVRGGWVAAQVLAVDEQGVLSIFSIKAGALLATKTVATSRVVKITAVLGRCAHLQLPPSLCGTARFPRALCWWPGGGGRATTC